MNAKTDDSHLGPGSDTSLGVNTMAEMGYVPID